MILALAALVQIAAADSLPRVTLRDALQRAARLDPEYVRAVGQVDNAEWVRRAALTAFFVPLINVASDITQASDPLFNFGTGSLLKRSSSATLVARLDLFTGGQKIAEMKRSRAELESAEAGEVQRRFRTAFLTESD